MTSSDRSIIVGAGQLAARPLTKADEALVAIDRLIDRAAEQRVDLLVLPECAYPAYWIDTVRNYRAAPVLSSEAFVARLTEQARKHRVMIASGLIEQAGGSLFNSAVLLDRDGRVLGRYRKTFLWDRDREWFTPGERIEPVHTGLGVIGMAICADVRCPEVIATLAAAGADLVAVPTCWVTAPADKGVHRNPQPEFLIEARSREFGLPFVCADKSGMETETVGYCGRSLITLADGTRAAEGPVDGELLVTARVSLPFRHRVMWMAERWERRLLSGQPAVLPSGEPHPVTVAAVPTVVAQQRFTGGMGETLFTPLQKRGVNLAVLNMPQEDLADRLEVLANTFDVRAVAFPHTCDPTVTSHGTIGCIGQRAIRTFAVARCLAMEGAQILAVFDAPEELALLRARALENRTFVVAVGERMAAVISPGGDVLDHAASTDPRECVVTIDLAQAADKTMAPNTHVWNQRRPGLYRFRPERAPRFGNV